MSTATGVKMISRCKCTAFHCPTRFLDAIWSYFYLSPLDKETYVIAYTQIETVQQSRQEGYLQNARIWSWRLLNLRWMVLEPVLLVLSVLIAAQSSENSYAAAWADWFMAYWHGIQHSNDPEANLPVAFHQRKRMPLSFRRRKQERVFNLEGPRILTSQNCMRIHCNCNHWKDQGILQASCWKILDSGMVVEKLVHLVVLDASTSSVVYPAASFEFIENRRENE